MKLKLISRSCIFNEHGTGFTLLEVLVALGLFAIFIEALTGVSLGLTRRNNDSEVKAGAMEAAQKTLDNIRLLDPTTLPTSGSSAAANVVAGERTYSVVTKYCTTAAYCASSNNRDIKVETSYKGNLIYSIETVYTKLR